MGEITMEEENYMRCENCNTIMVKLPFYVYPPKGLAVKVGDIIKCLNCKTALSIDWIPNRYDSERMRKLFIEANRGKYTRGLTEAELCSPEVFKIREDDTDFLTYSRRFQTLLKQYAK